MKPILDGHIHIMNPIQIDSMPTIQCELLNDMSKADISGGILLSPNPNIFRKEYSRKNLIEQVNALI